MLTRPTVRITDRITREQAAYLVLVHPTAESMAANARLTYRTASPRWQRAKRVDISLFIDDVPGDHLFQIKAAHKRHQHEIVVILSPRLPPEYRNAFQLYGLGLALDHLQPRVGTTWGSIGSQLDPRASRTGFDMVSLSEGARSVTELPWRRAA